MTRRPQYRYGRIGSLRVGEDGEDRVVESWISANNYLSGVAQIDTRR